MVTSTRITLPALLVALEYQVGFRLDGSLVVVALTGADLRLVERVDRPTRGLLDPHATRRLVTGLARRQPTSLLVVSYGSTESCHPDPVLSALAEAVAVVAPVDAVVSVSEGRWCSESGGAWLTLPDPAEVPLVAEYVGCGVAPLAGRSELRAALAHTPDPTVTPFVASGPGTPADNGGRAAWRRLLSGATSAQDEIAALSFLSDVRRRDLVLTRLVPTGAAPDDAAGSWQRLHPSPYPLEARSATRSVLMRLACIAPLAVRPAALCVLAVWAWNAGDGATAAVASDLALEQDPDYTLARLIDRLVLHDVRPPAA